MTITFHNLSVGYDRHPAVHHVSGSFAPSSFTAIVGPNGGGKSTLLKALIGFLKPMSGDIRLQDIALRDIAYLPQQSEVDRSFPLSVADVVALGHWNKSGAFRGLTQAQHAATQEALKSVGMDAFADRTVGALSMGQWQRVMFARLIVQKARVILLDEPFAAIDNRSIDDLMRLLHRWNEEGRTVIAVLHDLNLIRAHFPQTLLIARELVGWGKTGDVLSEQNLARASALAGNWVENAATCARDEAHNHRSSA